MFFIDYFFFHNKKRLRGKDTADLSTTIIIIVGIALAAILAIAAIAGVTKEKSKATAECIVNSGNFDNSTSAKEECELSMHGSGEKSVRDNFGNPPPGLVSDTNQQTYTANEKRIARDIKKFSIKIEKFYEKHGKYPNDKELIELNYSADKEAYPGFYGWNLEYCTSYSGSEFIIAANSWENTILYVSSENKQPGKYTVEGDIHAATGGDGYPPPCYRGTSYSAADRVGLKEIGVANEALNSVEPGTGPKSSVGKAGANWADWAQ